MPIQMVKITAMNSFANPEDARPFVYPEFPKPPSEITEYTNAEGVQGYVMKNLKTAEPFYAETDVTPVVQPALFQDFRNIMSPNQS
jgi:hypothetical protein